MLIGYLWVWVFLGWLGRITWINTFVIFGYCLMQTRALWSGYLGKITLIHTRLFFRSSSSGTCAWWRRSNLFFLSCLGKITFIYTFPWLLMSLSTSSHFGNNLLWLETTQCLPQDKIWSLTIMQQSFCWVVLSKIRLKTQDRRVQIFQSGLVESKTVLFPNINDQLCNWSTIKPPRNGAKHKYKLLIIVKDSRDDWL